MLVFWKAKLVLFALPKTGTTALEAALAGRADTAILNPPGMKHCNVQKYERELASFFENKGRAPLDRMAVVRNPIDWLGSWYRYRSRPALNGQPNSTAEVSFEQFVEAWLSDDPAPFAQIGTQARFLGAHNSGKPKVDHLFCYEHLALATAFLEERLATPLQLERRNQSPERKTDLSDALLARVETERAQDFAVWHAAKRA